MKQNQLQAARLLSLLPTAALLVAACGHGPQGGLTPPAPEVGVVNVEAGSLPLILEYTGRAAGSREVEVRARVSGILLERRYQEGRPVRQGDVLFRIDPEQYRAAAAQARAEVGVEHARLNEARRQKERVLQLVEKGLVSQMNRDEANSQFEVAEASVAAAEAKLRTAELNLGYTEVRAPIGGLTSHEARSEGSLVTAGADSSLLTRIVQVDPAYIEFSLPESDAALLRSRLVRPGVLRQRPAAARDGRAISGPGPAQLSRHVGGSGFGHRAGARRGRQSRRHAGAGPVPASARRRRNGRSRCHRAAPLGHVERAGQLRLDRRRGRRR